MELGIYDALVAVLIGGAAFFGWRKGLATQVASILSIGVSYFVAVRFRGQFSGMIDAEPPWDTVAAMLILYLGTSMLIWILFRQVRASIERMKLREFDRQMGFVFGGIKGLVLAGIVTMFAFSLMGNEQRQAILESKSGYWIAKFMVTANSVMPPEIQQFVAQYLGPLEQGFDLRQVFPESGPPHLGGYPVAEDPRFPSQGNPSPPYAPPPSSSEDAYPPLAPSPYRTGRGAVQYLPPNSASSDWEPNRR